MTSLGGVFGSVRTGRRCLLLKPPHLPSALLPSAVSSPLATPKPRRSAGLVRGGTKSGAADYSSPTPPLTSGGGVGGDDDTSDAVIAATRSGVNTTTGRTPRSGWAIPRPSTTLRSTNQSASRSVSTSATHRSTNQSASRSVSNPGASVGAGTTTRRRPPISGDDLSTCVNVAYTGPNGPQQDTKKRRLDAKPFGGVHS